MGENAIRGSKLLKIFQEKYGKHIEILAGAGIDSKNVVRLLDKTSVNQIHGTFKEYENDPTTRGEEVSFAYTEKGDYEQVDPLELNKVVAIVRNYELEKIENNLEGNDETI